ncbi:lipase family protein [Nocardia sp. alder85J]|uniref:lipase family protein n=1 Tax=Nocardia sp. alder85J TaxID=2862949 RepID=UPI001CD31175|nr:lipase family protein [Nocardia sp. alder85J]MCX4096326.1 lipase family protein [Nocardia sp. alder85J]
MTVNVDVIGRMSAASMLLAPSTDPPRPPSEDPFYYPPSGLEGYAPGTILRSRPIEIALFGLVPQQVSAWQLLYRSTDLHGRPEAVVTTVLLPTSDDDTPATADRPLLAFQSAIDSVTDRCAPSYALRRGAWAPGSITQLEWLMVASALRRGWAVSIADHGGSHGNFGAPREPGYRALDGVRAALHFTPLGLRSDTPVAAWGYSGGGMASSWLVEMAPTYAPEIRLAGAVLGAPVGDPGRVFARLNGGCYSGFPALVIAALTRSYPALARVMDADLTDGGRSRLAMIARSAPMAVLVRMAFHSIDEHLQRPLAEVLAEPGMQAMLDDLRLGDSTPACPLLVVQPVHDQVIHAEGVDDQVARYRRGGASVTYIRDRLSEHFSLLPLATPLALDWLADRIAGLPAPADETRTVWSVAAAPARWRGLLDMAGTAARIVLGQPLRQESEPEVPSAPTLAA